jgi:hypothetical protein
LETDHTLVRLDERLERGRNLASGEGVPVDGGEEVVRLELGGIVLGAQAVLRVAVEELHVAQHYTNHGAAGRTALTKSLPLSPMIPLGNLILPKQMF